MSGWSAPWRKAWVCSWYNLCKSDLACIIILNICHPHSLSSIPSDYSHSDFSYFCVCFLLDGGICDSHLKLVAWPWLLSSVVPSQLQLILMPHFGLHCLVYLCDLLNNMQVQVTAKLPDCACTKNLHHLCYLLQLSVLLPVLSAAIAHAPVLAYKNGFALFTCLVNFIIWLLNITS